MSFFLSIQDKIKQVMSEPRATEKTKQKNERKKDGKVISQIARVAAAAFLCSKKDELHAVS